MSAVVSGLIGAAIAGAISALWLKRYPYKLSPQLQSSLRKKYKSSVNFCSTVAVVILIAAVFLLKSGTVANDWTWGLFFLGGALASPLITLSIPIAKGGHKFSEAHAALAIKSKSPIALQFFCIILGLVMFIAGCIGFVIT